MPISRLKKLYHQTKRDLLNTATYVRMTLEGNKVQKLTDFASCQHPVLLLYGFGATRRTVSILERRLRRDGFCVFSFNLGGIFKTFNTRCIEEGAEFIQQKVERLCQRFNLSKISIIGHSQGGLIGRYYVKRLGGAKRVRSLITLAAPHNGNHWAILGLATPLALISKSLRQMVPMSPFIRKLKQGPFPKNVRFTSIYSRGDRVCYYKSAMLEIRPEDKNLKNIDIPGLSHSDFVIRRSVYNVIKRELVEGEKE
ncbi:MAG: alpha/beta fold hydrolase [Deltaproteobacteria bacterium]|nr:alpha/beta fold hydrolase [Deltaproteobacteria bacterium]